jgi:hypothetical protein
MKMDFVGEEMTMVMLEIRVIFDKNITFKDP